MYSLHYSNRYQYVVFESLKHTEDELKYIKYLLRDDILAIMTFVCKDLTLILSKKLNVQNSVLSLVQKSQSIKETMRWEARRHEAISWKNEELHSP